MTSSAGAGSGDDNEGREHERVGAEPGEDVLALLSRAFDRRRERAPLAGMFAASHANAFRARFRAGVSSSSELELWGRRLPVGVSLVVALCSSKLARIAA